MSHKDANTRRFRNGGLTLAQRLRHWPNINPPMTRRLVFTGMYLPVLHGYSPKVAQSELETEGLSHRLHPIKNVGHFFGRSYLGPKTS